jgi:hypothetical protein
VTTSSGRWLLRPGRRLTFGRAGCEIPFGSDPPDTEISRHAGTLSESEGAVVVASTGRHPLLLLDDDGAAQRTIAPGQALSAYWVRFRIVALGRHGARYEIEVLHNRVRRASAGEDTIHRQVRLTPTERKLLAALCEERLRSNRPTAPFATYRQIAERVSRDDNYVRNRLAAVRTTLSSLGVPGLQQDEGPSGRRLPDYVNRLGEWALAAGIVTPADLVLLDESG